MIEGQEGVTWDDWVALAEACESHGVEAMFRSDHYVSGTDESRPVLDASPRPHKLFRRHMPLRITSAIVGTIAGIVVVGLIGSAGERGRLSRNEMIVADSALAVELASLSLSSWLARAPEASELAAAYNADLRDRLGLDR